MEAPSKAAWSPCVGPFPARSPGGLSRELWLQSGSIGSRPLPRLGICFRPTLLSAT